MRKLFIAVTCITFLASCSKKNPTIYENDTEPHEWIGQTSITQVANSHSGKSASLIDSLNPYSLGLQKKIKDINGGKFKTIIFSYWVFIKSDSIKAYTVLSVDYEGKNLNWEGHPLKDKIKERNKWVQVNETFTLPPTAEPDNNITLYVWNPLKEEVLIDDLRIVFN
ncbi:MAG: hypothetical protein ABI315_08430 [Bacteroidia bacterium]